MSSTERILSSSWSVKQNVRVWEAALLELDHTDERDDAAKNAQYSEGVLDTLELLEKHAHDKVGTIGRQLEAALLVNLPLRMSLISSHSRLHVTVMKRSAFPNWRTTAMAS